MNQTQINLLFHLFARQDFKVLARAAYSFLEYLQKEVPLEEVSHETRQQLGRLIKLSELVDQIEDPRLSQAHNDLQLLLKLANWVVDNLDFESLYEAFTADAITRLEQLISEYMEVDDDAATERQQEQTQSPTTG
jgi:hypothetical protein